MELQKIKRRNLLKILGGGLVLKLSGLTKAQALLGSPSPIILSTWHNQGQTANKEAWEQIQKGKSALDAVEAGARIIESDITNCCVGLGAYPDREGKVTLDACIMDDKGRCGGVAFLERIKHPITLARMVMENTPHVLMVGEGAQQFAIKSGLTLEERTLSEHASKAYSNWLKKSKYEPQINIEQNNQKFVPVPHKLENGNINHDTIGIIAMDKNGDLSGACTTSGMAFKLRGRVGDSPIIGAGLYVDNKIGAATATGNGEEVIRTSGSFLVVEFMRQGLSPEEACKKACQRLLQMTPNSTDQIQIGFIAINKTGEFGGYSLKPGFDYTVTSNVFNHEKRVPNSILN